ncbi:NAD-dependent succinate-semialdehyde dehydrogenase [Persicobacter psychrovividus]|uniref:Succinate-semialdehyde dehydrogenase n=1 Tax=Persicobacter psychrovividus TaxID=387638 RepID=A0ABM7VL70_9BACT|nr:succinate-semialdehyde dehydrogenase [Persicobacter psychrovividus]
MSDILQSINPYTGEVLATFPKLNEEAIDNAIDQSAKAFKEWSVTGIDQRCEVTKALAKLLTENKRSLAEMITREMGKPISESLAEVDKCILLVNYFAEQAPTILQPKKLPSDFDQSYLRYDPIGTIVAVMPWNFPLWQVIRFAVPTMLAGNAVMLKHASNVLGCGEFIQQLFQAAGYPLGSFRHLLIDSSQVEQVIAHPQVQGVTLTGSGNAGKAVAQLAGKYLKKCVLELGGSDALTITETADLDTATDRAFRSRMMNSGQTCIAAKRFIVHASIEEQVIEKLKALNESWRIGDPMDEETQMSVMSRTDLVDTVEEQLDKLIEQGAELVFGGNRKDNHFEPTLLRNITTDMLPFHDEIFGPVGVIVTYETEAEMVELINGVPFGLGSSFWTQDEAQAERVIPQIQAGALAINEMVKSSPKMPFGGVKESGFGREMGAEGMLEFTNMKTVIINGFKK